MNELLTRDYLLVEENETSQEIVVHFRVTESLPNLENNKTTQITGESPEHSQDDFKLVLTQLLLSGRL